MGTTLQKLREHFEFRKEKTGEGDASKNPVRSPWITEITKAKIQQCRMARRPTS